MYYEMWNMLEAITSTKKNKKRSSTSTSALWNAVFLNCHQWPDDQCGH